MPVMKERFFPSNWKFATTSILCVVLRNLTVLTAKDSADLKSSAKAEAPSYAPVLVPCSCEMNL